jgi:hypothetical protein
MAFSLPTILKEGANFVRCYVVVMLQILQGV